MAGDLGVQWKYTVPTSCPLSPHALARPTTIITVLFWSRLFDDSEREWTPLDGYRWDGVAEWCVRRGVPA